MQTNYFSPSINIQRDRNKTLNYIPTRNGEKAFRKITSTFLNGTKSFNIIGAYGSGKSAFILALDKVLNNHQKYFLNPFKNQYESFKSTYIIGDYSSFKDTFIEEFKLKHKKDIFVELRNLIEEDSHTKKGHLIIIDEFGKFLEYAAIESPEEELYFIQQLAEFVNTPELPILLITTLHQPFEDYALTLSKAQRNEWGKVKGRLVEVSFNEPVEHLLSLASDRINQKSYPCSIKVTEQRLLFETIQKAEVFPLRDYFSFDVAKKLFPFDILSASISIVAFQRYGQNERSLFSFLESTDYLGINDFVDGNEFYNIYHVYRYLKYNFHTLLNSRFNVDSAHWRALDEALQRIESIFDKEYTDASKILIVISLTTILGRQGQKITKEFLNSYSKYALGIQNAAKIIEKLESKQIIRYRNYSQCYVLFKGTDFDLNAELDLAEDLVSKDFSIVRQLKKHFNFPIIPAKRAYHEFGTQRYFVYELSENPINITPEGQIDGYINLVFNEFLNEEKVREFSKKCEKAILFGLYKYTDELKRIVIDIEKIQIAKARCIDDQIAISELDFQLYAAQEELSKAFQLSFYGDSSSVEWYFDGEVKHFQSAKQLNLFLSEICKKVYYKTPVFRNELMNREKVSGTISSAKNNLIRYLLENVSIENLGIERFPPEKSIYLALLRNTGIHKVNNGKWELGKPEDKSFLPIWKTSEKFLNNCVAASQKLSELITILKKSPFKLKQGFIDFWVPVFLIAKQKDFALYESDTFIPQLTDDLIEVAMKQPHKYRISTFDLDKTELEIFNRYRFFLNQLEEKRPDSETFIETVKPFIGFYNRLDPFAKQTNTLSDKALRLRNAISQATDPEKVFFEAIPGALGFNKNDFVDDQKIEDFTIALQSSTRELSSAVSKLINRIEAVINNSIGAGNMDYPENKSMYQKRFKSLRNRSIKPNLRALHQRIDSPLDDRQSWINSIAYIIIGKSMDNFTDDDERNFKSLFESRIYELDNLTDISETDIDKENEEVLRLEITSFVKGVQNNLVRLPKSKSAEIAKLEKKIRPMLKSDDKQANIALLIKLLQEEIENE